MTAATSRHRRWALPGTVVSLCSLVSSLALGSVLAPRAVADPIADARSQAAQLASQIAAESQRANALSEEYDAARLRVASLDGQVWTDQLQIASAEQRVQALQREVRRQAVSAFVEQGSSSSLTALFGNERDLTLREHYLGVAASQSVSAIDRLKAARDALAAQQAKLQQARTQAKAALSAIGAAEQAVQAETAQEQATLSQVKGNIAQLVAQQQQAQALARQRAFLAQVASQQSPHASSSLAAPSGGAGKASPAPVTAAPPVAVPRAVPPPVAAPSPPPPSPAPSGPAPSFGGGGAAAVAAAESLEGVPYVWGGASRSGVDCSGLVMLAWEAAGVSLPHYSGAQWSAVAHVSAGALQPGDIIFYGPGGSDHEALYVGGGMEIEALHTGTVVGIFPVGYAGTPSGYGRP